MTPEETQILSVLDAIALNSRVSQRDLSRATGLNLAKVNHLLRRLAEKGQVKLRNASRNPDKLRYFYVLTPGGLAEKSRLTVRFAARTWREYSVAIERLRDRLEELARTGAHRVVLLGANDVSRMILEASRGLDGLAVIAVVDPRQAGAALRGIPIVESIVGLEFDRALPCEDGDLCPQDLAARAGVPEQKVFLV